MFVVEQDQLGDYGLDAKQAQNLNDQIQEFDRTHKTNKWLQTALYYVDLQGLEFKQGAEYRAIVDYANTDYLQIYRPNSGGTFDAIAFGDELALNKVHARYRLPSITLGTDGQPAPYLIIQAIDTIKIQFNVLIDDQAAFEQRVQRSQLNYGLLFGAIITLSIYSLILFFFTRERSYFWYSSYLLCMVVLLLSNNGLGHFFVWPETAGLTTKLGFISTGGLILTMSMFVNSFINLRQGFAANNAITRVVMTCTALCMLGSALLDHGTLDMAYFSLATIQMLNILVIAFIAFKQQQVASTYLFLGYLTLFPAIGISILKFSGLLDSTPITNHALEASLIIEAFILSIGVGEKIRQIKTMQFTAVDELRNSKQKFLSTLINEREREKKEFGVVLHNSVVQNLAVLRNKLDSIAKTDDSGHRSIINVIDNTIDDVREISHQSYPHILEQFGLAEAAKNYAETNLDTREIDWSCNIQDQQLDRDQMLPLYRIIQESINNTYRHADASKVTINLETNDNHHLLTIKDDGCGFDDSIEGFGLSLIKQYALHLGGVAEITSTVNRGSSTLIRF